MLKLRDIEQIFLHILQEDSSKNEINKEIQGFGPADWEKLYELATKSGLFPKFYTRLLNLGLEGIPAKFLFKLKNIYFLNLKRNTLLEQELCRIVAYFKELNIPIVPLKGPVLAKFLYGDVALRRVSCDLDLLVRPEHFEAAEEALININYISCDSGSDKLFKRNFNLKYARQLHFSGKLADGGGIALELHADLRGLFVYYPLEDFWHSLKEIYLGENKILMPANETLLIYLALVTMSTSEFIELRYLYDIYTLISKFKDKLDWLKVANSIKDTRHKAAVFFSLTLSQSFFHFDIPKDFLKLIKPNIIKRLLLGIWINKNNVLHKEVNRSYSWYCFFLIWRYFVTSWLYSENIIDCIRIIQSKIFLPANEMAGLYSKQLSEASYSLYIKKLLKPISWFLKKGVVRDAGFYGLKKEPRYSQSHH